MSNLERFWLSLSLLSIIVAVLSRLSKMCTVHTVIYDMLTVNRLEAALAPVLILSVVAPSAFL